MIYFQTFIFYCLYSLSMFVIALIGLLTFILPYQYRYAWLSKWAKLNITLLKKIVGIGSVIEGLENIPNENEKVIVLSNHQSAWETLFFQTLFKEQTWLLKRELLWIPIFGWALAMLKPIAINRTKGFKSLKKLLNDGQKTLNQKIWLIIYPEGTRKPYGYKSINKIEEIKIGGVKLAASSDCKILMIRHNAGKYWPKKGRFKKGDIKLEIAPAFESDDLKEIRQKCADFFFPEK